MKEPDLGSSLKPASDSRSPGELGKCLQGLEPDQGQGGILACSPSPASDDRTEGKCLCLCPCGEG